MDPQWYTTGLGYTYTHDTPDGRRYCSISLVGERAELRLWTRDTGFSPPTYTYDTLNLARQEGGAWWKDPHYLPSERSRIR